MNKLPKIKTPGLSRVIPILAVLMEVFWVYTCIIWVSRIAVLNWANVPFNLVSCIVLALFTQIVVRAALAGKWTLRRVRWTILPLCFLLLAVLIRLNLNGGFAFFDPAWLNFIPWDTPRLITACICGVILIWRGIRAGQGDNSFSSLYHRFLFGLVVIILVLIIWRFGGSPISNVWDNLGIEIILFFGCGLLAMAISNLERFRSELAQYQESTSSFTRRWTSILILLVVGILGLGIVMVSIFSSASSTSIIHFLSVLGDWLLKGLFYLLYPLGLVAQVLVYIIRYLVSLLRREPPPQDTLDRTINDLNELMKNPNEAHLPVALIIFLKWAAILLVCGLVIFFLSRILSRYWNGKSEEGIEEVNETLGSWQLFSKDLRSILAYLFGWLRRKSKAVQSPASPYFEIDSGDAERRLTIREMYQALLWEGRRSGSPRFKNETPYEYCRRLQGQRAYLTNELNVLTEAYIIERYGQINPEAEKVTSLNKVWRSLREKFRSKETQL